MREVVASGSGVALSSIVMGTWQAGGDYWPGVVDGEITAPPVHTADHQAFWRLRAEELTSLFD